MKVHFIGIGGIGVSALAQYYLAKGHEVSGSDLVASEITDFLKNKGVKIIINPNDQISITNQIPNPKFQNMALPNLVVYSPAVKKENPELKLYREKGIKCLSYPEALGELTKEYFTIAVSGAHGKSTTTAMLALVLIKAGLDPTVIVGTKVKEFNNSNFRAGKSKYLVIEACEYDSSFLHYSPKIIVVTNIDKEHLDYFKTFANVKKAFKKFIMRLPPDGFLVFNRDDKNLSVIARSVATKQSQLRKAKQRLRLLRFARNDGEAKKLKNILKVPGQHNVSNALAVLSVTRILAIPDNITFKALSEFKGTWRRFEIKNAELRGNLRGKTRKIKIISDYAHHPNEIKATLKAAREKYPQNPSGRLRARKIWCVFQPHQYQRTHYLFNDFVKVFRQVKIDNIVITDIYDVAGRETKKISAETSSEKLVKKIYPVKYREAVISPKTKLFNLVRQKNVIYLPMKEVENYIKKNIKSGDILIIMGAGNIYKLADKF